MNITAINSVVPASIERIVERNGLKTCVVAARANMSNQMFSDMLNGRRLIKRLIEHAQMEMKDNPMTPGMLAVYNEMHADIMAHAAEVNAMIAAG